jgi:hypothetical protein
MAIITRAFKITSTTLQDIFTFDTDATILGISKSSLYSTVYTKLFDTTNTGYDIAIFASGSVDYLTKKTTAFIPQGSALRYSSTYASVSAPEYVSVTYYYEDSSTDTVNAIGVWNSTTTYAKNSIVYRSTNNTSYIANVSNVNKPPESSSGYWQILAGQNVGLNITLSSELTSDTSGSLTGATTTLGLGSTLTNKTLAGTTRFSNDRFYDSTGTYYYQLPVGASGELVDTASSQILVNKTLENCTINNPTLSYTVNFTTGSTISLTNSYIVDGVQSLGNSFSSNAFTFTTNLYGITKLTTPATASATLTITLPTITTANTGTSCLIFITMGAATQTIAWANTKIAGSITPSQTANAIDIYSVINDGTYWYLTLLDKGFA